MMRRIISVSIAIILSLSCACCTPTGEYDEINITDYDEAAPSVYTETTPFHSPSSTPISGTGSSLKTVRDSYQELRKEYNNDEIVGYLKIEGTSVDYLVTQASDNEFYLDNDIHRRESVAGWIFMDYENNISLEDKNIVIYGHNMKKDIMFHDLRFYVSEDFYKDHRYVIFNTVYEDYVWEIFSFYKADTDFRYIQVIFPSEEDFGELLTEMKARSLYDTGVKVTSKDRILTLSTCVGNQKDERYVINAKLVQT